MEESNNICGMNKGYDEDMEDCIIFTLGNLGKIAKDLIAFYGEDRDV